MSNISFTTAWKHLRRAPFQAMAAIFVLTITFFVTTVLALMVYSTSQVINYFETRPEVIAFLKDESTSEQVASLQAKLEQDQRINEVNYVSKEEALEIYKEATANNPMLSELVSPSIFPASLEFSLSELTHAEEVIEGIKNEEIVDEVGFTASLGGEDTLSDVVGKLKRITWYLRLGGGSFVLFLLGTSFIVLLVIMGMRMNVRKGEIEILDLIGAKPSFIRGPILAEAVIYAIFGVLFGWVAALILILYTTPSLLSYFGDIPFLPKDTFELLKILLIILGGEILIGLFISVIGSMVAVSRVKLRR